MYSGFLLNIILHSHVAQDRLTMIILNRISTKTQVLYVEDIQYTTLMFRPCFGDSKEGALIVESPHLQTCRFPNT